MLALIRKPGSHWTRRWRKGDSNPRSRRRGETVPTRAIWFFRGNLENVRSLPMTIRHTEGINIMPPLTKDRFESYSLQRRVLQIRWSRQISADLQIVRRLMVAHVVLSIVLIVAGIILTLRARP